MSEQKPDWAEQKAQKIYGAYGRGNNHNESWLVPTIASALRAEREARNEDTERLDWLESMANGKGGILLHDGSEAGRLGLGLRPGYLSRTLRQAIDAARKSEPPQGGRA